MGFGGGLSGGGFTWNMDRLAEGTERLELIQEENLKKTQAEVDKAYEEKLALFDQLDTTRKEDLASFTQTYNSLSAGEKKNYLWTMYDSGELTEDEYKDEVHSAYLTQAQNNANQGIYTGYVPFEYEGQTLFVEARQLDPDVPDNFKSSWWFIGASVRPHDTFYFPEQHAKQPELTEKDWLAGMADESGYITYVDGVKYNPGGSTKFSDSPQGRASAILDPDKSFGEFIAPMLNVLGAITKNPIFTAVGTHLGGGDAKDFVKNQVGSLILQDILPADLLETELSDWDIDGDLFGIDPEDWTEGLGKVQIGATKGKDIQDGLEKEFGIEVAGNILQGTVDIGTGVAGEIITEGDALVANINDFVIEPLEQRLYALAGTETGQNIGDFIETAKDLGQDIIDPIDTALDAVGDFVVDPALQAGKAVGEAIIDPIDTALDAVGDFVDPALQAGSDVLSEGEDVLKDIGRGIDDLFDYKELLSPNVDRGTPPQFRFDVLPTTQTNTQTEDLFSKELFGFDFKEQDEFSQEMLSPLMNLRKYG